MLALAERLALPVRLAHRVGGWLLLVLALVIGYDVVGRKFFDTGSVVLQDLEWHLHGAALLLGFGGAYLKDAHVRVDLLRERLGMRTKARMEVFGILVFMIPYLAILAFFAVEFAVRAYLSGEGSVAGGGLPQRWIIKSFLPLGLVLVVLSALSVLLKCLHYLRDGADISGPFGSRSKSRMTSNRNDLSSESCSTSLKERAESRNQVGPPDCDLL